MKLKQENELLKHQLNQYNIMDNNEILKEINCNSCIFNNDFDSIFMR